MTILAPHPFEYVLWYLDPLLAYAACNAATQLPVFFCEIVNLASVRTTM